MKLKEVLILVAVAGGTYYVFKSMKAGRAYPAESFTNDVVGWWRSLPGITVGSEQARMLEQQDAAFYNTTATSILSH